MKIVAEQKIFISEKSVRNITRNWLITITNNISSFLDITGRPRNNGDMLLFRCSFLKFRNT
jgi:hypothetical protein